MIQEKTRWHLDKTVSITHIFSTITAIVTLVLVGSHFDTRISILEKEIAYRDARDARQDAEITLFKQDVKQDLRDISYKLDIVLEAKNNHK